jgi:hypothetical protein
MKGKKSRGQARTKIIDIIPEKNQDLRRAGVPLIRNKASLFLDKKL